MKQDKGIGEVSHGTVGSQVVTWLGITQNEGGYEAAVAFYILSLIILLTRSRIGYLYYNGYSICKVSKKEKKGK